MTKFIKSSLILLSTLMISIASAGNSHVYVGANISEVENIQVSTLGYIVQSDMLFDGGIGFDYSKDKAKDLYTYSLVLEKDILAVKGWTYSLGTIVGYESSKNILEVVQDRGFSRTKDEADVGVTLRMSNDTFTVGLQNHKGVTKATVGISL